jgi:hypothetical protein
VRAADVPALDDIVAYYQWSQDRAARQLEAYDFAADAAFQQGLHAILKGRAAADAVAEEQHAQLFYFARCAVHGTGGVAVPRR